MSFGVVFHGWRGGAFDRNDLFHFVVTAGFVSVYLCKSCVLDQLHWLSQQIGRLQRALDPEQAVRLNGGE